MNKKISLIVSVISAVLVTLVLASYLLIKGKFSPISPISNITPTPAAEELSNWVDPAEFSFQYPKSLSVNPHNEDQENYAHVELTSATRSGNLIIWVKDTTAETIDDWITQQKIKNAIDSSLDGAPAKKLLTTGDVNKLTISAIQGGYLYQIEANLTDSEFWNEILDKVMSSFKFVSSTQEAPTDQGSADAGEAEEEEVIE